MAGTRAVRGLAVGLSCALALALAGPARADCRLALALAFDVSRSVDPEDYRIQKQGLLAALEDPEVVAANQGPAEPVALAQYEWSRNTHQTLVVDWTLVRSEADLASVRARIAAHPRHPYPGTTALGEALAFGAELLKRAPDCVERVIDVSGDGQNNSGRAPRTIYEDPDFPADRVNGLAIRGHERDVVDYYREHLIYGPGAFVEVAETPEDFPRAIRRKLIRELTEQMMGEDRAGPPPRG